MKRALNIKFSGHSNFKPAIGRDTSRARARSANRPDVRRLVLVILPDGKVVRQPESAASFAKFPPRRELLALAASLPRSHAPGTSSREPRRGT